MAAARSCCLAVPSVIAGRLLGGFSAPLFETLGVNRNSSVDWSVSVSAYPGVTAIPAGFQPWRRVRQFHLTQRTFLENIAMVGIDLGKHVFHIHWQDSTAKAVRRMESVQNAAPQNSNR